MKPLRFPCRLIFRSPEKSEIVILHNPDYWIKSLVLGNLHSTTLDIYPKELYISAKVLLRTLFRLVRINSLARGGSIGVRDLLRMMYHQYLLACIDVTGARVVVTMIDNSSYFQILSRLDQEKTYFAIQNGTRTPFCVGDFLESLPSMASTISMTNFFCFGQRDVELFRNYGHKIDNFYPIGSLIGGYYENVIADSAVSVEYDLCLISQWNEHLFREVGADDPTAPLLKSVAQSLTILNSFLLRLIQETGLTLVVCPRNDNDDAEVAFFRQAFGSAVTIAPSDRKDFSTYRVVKKSRLALALNSTALLEAFSSGQKVLWCNLLSDEYFSMPSAATSYFQGGDYEAFKRKVTMILDMPQDEYEIETRERAHYINNYDPSNPPHEVIRKAIVSALSSRKCEGTPESFCGAN
jgi:surface carbohydrate biosynthesis protein